MNSSCNCCHNVQYILTLVASGTEKKEKEGKELVVQKRKKRKAKRQTQVHELLQSMYGGSYSTT